GVFVAFTIENVTQRLRWIPPGRFRMGSPENEPGRWDDEGPQHKVYITQGFWLADTPCTQALWEAVMNDNPSRFKSPRRPVEQISWNQVQTFLQTINAKLPGLDLCLPTEAQWEHACRASTDTALYNGPIEIIGERNAPALDPIAWYGGNSGVGFDLPEGENSSSWPEMQYPNRKSGTREVGKKQPNPWGLHDMLGNVWEWCADGKRTYSADTVIDPLGPLETGAARVVRGGCWHSLARICRCAYRSISQPGVQDLNAGFRCARVQS
ncbi:MAG: formylglycine-generating enzyme family protein, partial [Candidatus Methylumidiphilus sp.]